MADLCIRGGCEIPVFDILQSLYVLSGEYDYGDVINEGISDTVLGAYMINNYTLQDITDDICYLFRIERRYGPGTVTFYRSRELGTELVIAANIDGEELIATEESDAWSVLKSNFLNSSQVPTQISLKFLDPDNDFKENVLTSKRPDAMRTDPIKQLALPLVMTVAQADQLVSIVLNDARAITQEHQFTLPPRFCYLTKGDNIIIRDRNIAVTVNVTTADLNADNTVSCTGRAVYSQANTPKPALPSIPRNVTGGAIAPTVGVVLDIPAFAPGEMMGDFFFETYVGTAPQNKDAWPGGYMTRQPQSGGAVTLFHQYAPNVMIVGVCSNALTDKQWVTDEDPLEVAFSNFEWKPEYDRTRDELDANPYANFAVYGAPGRWEIIRYESYQDGKLTNIRRGMRGTELHCGSHQPGDTLYIPNGGFVVQRLDRAVVGKSDEYRAVTEGANYAGGQVLAPPAYQGNSRRPYAPAVVRASRDGAGDVTVTWQRRDRGASGAWGDPAMSEQAEVYTVAVYSGNTIKRTLNATEESVTYTAADQATDGLASADTLKLAVTQIGDIGPGFTTVREVNVGSN